jgi:hypothetical protein
MGRASPEDYPRNRSQFCVLEFEGNSWIMLSSIKRLCYSPGSRGPRYVTRRWPGTLSFAGILLISTSFGTAAQNSSTITTQGDPIRLAVKNFPKASDSIAVLLTDPAAILRAAKVIYVRKKSVYFKAPELEHELRKRPEFQRWGLVITRNESGADLIIEVGRKVFTTRFIYTVIDPRTDIVVTSGKLSSLGGTLATKIAKRFIEQMQQVR